MPSHIRFASIGLNSLGTHNPKPQTYSFHLHTNTAIMAHLNKIAATSPSRQRPSELETDISKALYDLESNIPDMKSALRPLQFVSAREVRLSSPKLALKSRNT